MKEHVITGVERDSIASGLGIKPGDVLLEINNKKIEDIFDFHFLSEDEHIEIKIKKESGEEVCLSVDKEEDEPLGLIFKESLMDNYRSCYNKCIFCFIDQNPPGMRETIYFKDDDSRLSFLQGNYITLTNMKESDIKRIIDYKLAPINISVHTTNPELRCQMLNNRFAGNVLKYIDELYQANIPMNAQIVLCKGYNDKEELERTIGDLLKYAPVLASLSIVPVGLTNYREGLVKLDPFTGEDAKEVIETVERFQKIALEKHGIHFVHASDEWYINAGYEIPGEETYDGYIQIENGVGMVRLMLNEFHDAVSDVCEFSDYLERKGFFKHFIRLTAEEKLYKACLTENKNRVVSTITGKLAYGLKEYIFNELKRIRPDITFNVYPIENNFFGDKITVTGLLTGRDICEQLKGKNLGDALIIPGSCLKADEDIFLDDMTVDELQRTLQVKTIIVKSNGMDYLRSIIGV